MADNTTNTDNATTETEFELAKQAAEKLKDSASNTTGPFTPDIAAADIPK